MIETPDMIFPKKLDIPKIFLKSGNGCLACLESTCQRPAVVELSPREAFKIKIQKHPKCSIQIQHTFTCIRYWHQYANTTIYLHKHLTSNYNVVKQYNQFKNRPKKFKILHVCIQQSSKNITKERNAMTQPARL